MTEQLVDHWGDQPGDSAWSAALDQISAGLDALTALNPGFLPAAEQQRILVRMQALGARQSAVMMGLLASGNIASELGDRDAAGWLASALHVDPRAAHARTRLARDLEEKWSPVGSALAAGEISVEQASSIVHALNQLADEYAEATPEQLLAAERMLLEEAADLGPKDLRRAGHRIIELVAPQVFEAAEARRLAREEAAAQKRVTLTSRNRGDGTMEFYARIPLSAGVRLKTYLEAFAQPRKQALAAKGKRQPWDRLLGQAFVRLVELLDPDALPHHGGDATTVMITMSLDQLRNELGTASIGYEGDTISAAEARRMACNAEIIPVVMNGASEVLDLGRASRLANRVQRKYLRMRDRTCRAEGCTVPAPWTDIHHLDPWVEGGRTDLDNLISLCGHHHHTAHNPAYQMVRRPDGTVSFHRRT